MARDRIPGERTESESVGPNAWLVDEMYEQFVADPNSVSESWREFFADYRPASTAPPPTRPSIQPTPAVAVPPPKAATAAAAPAAPAEGEPIRGASARIVKNMQASLAMPTAT